MIRVGHVLVPESRFLYKIKLNKAQEATLMTQLQSVDLEAIPTFGSGAALYDHWFENVKAYIYSSLQRHASLGLP